MGDVAGERVEEGQQVPQPQEFAACGGMDGAPQGQKGQEEIQSAAGSIGRPDAVCLTVACCLIE